MAKPRPSGAIKDILVSRDIALWDAHHYNVSGRATTKDPISVCLVTPRASDMMFYGHGPTCDEAVINALNRNTALNSDSEGVIGAMARLEIALHDLTVKLWLDRSEYDEDIPF